MAGVEPEDKEALGESPAEELTMVRLQSKASKRRTQVLLSVLAAILIIGLVVVLAVVGRKKDIVDASAGGSGGSPTGTGTAATTSILETERCTMANVKLVRHTSPPSTVIVHHVTNQAKSTSGACPSA